MLSEGAALWGGAGETVLHCVVGLDEQWVRLGCILGVGVGGGGGVCGCMNSAAC